MVSKSFVLAVAGATAAQAVCTFPYAAQLPANPVYKPSGTDTPTIGVPYPVSYDGTGLGPKLTFILLRGPGDNIVEVGPIASDVANCGTSSCVLTWTPASNLEPDTTHYGIKMLDETSCNYQYTTQFGLNAGTSPAKSSSAAAPASSAAKGSASPAPSKMSVAPSAAASAASTSTDCDDSSPTGYSAPSGGYKTNSTYSSAGASATYKPVQSNDAGRFAISAFGAIVAFAAAIMVL